MEDLKLLRKEKKLTQQQAADHVGISIRSYKSYENDMDKKDSLKYKYIFEKIQKLNPIDETHGILSLQDISDKCLTVFQEYTVNYCILFGSYARGTAGESSDIDLLISSDIKGLRFYGMVEALRQSLHKKVDVLNSEQLKNNLPLTDEILKYGIRIYG